MQPRNCEFTHPTHSKPRSRESARVIQSSLKIALPPLRSRACTHIAHTSISHVYWACTLDPLDAHSFVVLGLGWLACHVGMDHMKSTSGFRGCAKCVRMHTPQGSRAHRRWSRPCFAPRPHGAPQASLRSPHCPTSGQSRSLSLGCARNEASDTHLQRIDSVVGLGKTVRTPRVTPVCRAAERPQGGLADVDISTVPPAHAASEAHRH
jgi:hypothetical protein